MTKRSDGPLVLKVIQHQKKQMFECVGGKMYSIKTGRPRKYSEAYELIAPDTPFLFNNHVRIERGGVACHCFLVSRQQRDNIVVDLQYGKVLQKYAVEELKKVIHLDETAIQNVPEDTFDDVPGLFKGTRGTCALLAKNFKDGDVISVRMI